MWRAAHAASSLQKRGCWGDLAKITQVCSIPERKKKEKEIIIKKTKKLSISDSCFLPKLGIVCRCIFFPLFLSMFNFFS